MQRPKQQTRGIKSNLDRQAHFNTRKAKIGLSGFTSLFISHKNGTSAIRGGAMTLNTRPQPCICSSICMRCVALSLSSTSLAASFAVYPLPLLPLLLLTSSTRCSAKGENLLCYAPGVRTQRKELVLRSQRALSPVYAFRGRF
jgi:hypothetical protein